MLVVRVSFLTGNVVAHLDKVPGELAIAANNQCDMLSLCAIRLHFSEHRAAGVPSAQVIGVLLTASLRGPALRLGPKKRLKRCPGL